MKAAVFYGPRDIRVEEVEKPTVEPYEILVKVRACGICGSDMHTYKLGIFREVGLPTKSGGMILGHEYAGDVVEAGAQVQGVKVGDRVIALSLGGGMAEYVKVFTFLNGNVFHMPKEMTYEEATTVEPLAVSLHATNVAAPEKGETVLIVGAGIIGLGILQVLKVRGSNKVIMVDLSPPRRALAKRLGADFVIDPSAGQLFDQVMQIVGPAPTTYSSVQTCAINTAIDCVGLMVGVPGPSVVEQLLPIVREGGKVVLVGAYEDKVALDLNMIMGKGLKVLGSIAYLPQEFAEAIELVQTARVDRKTLISKVFSLDQAKEAFELQLKGGETVKVILRP
jgi:2-desacetyl-2-hydroxyethyl bacteriochlorophyllide A dehydrogenase